MKIEFDSAALAGVAGWAAQALPQRPAVPVLAGMRLDAQDTTLTVSAFDYDTSATATVAATVAEGGQALLPGKLLAEITRSLPAGPATLVVDTGHATLTCGRATFTLLTLPLHDYPALPALPATAGTIGSVAFAEAASQVTGAASRDDTLPALTAVLMEAGAGGNLALVCTDRYRLAIRKVTWDPSLADDTQALVPARALAAAGKAMTSGDTVAIALGEGMAGFTGAGKTLVTRQIAGDFPPYTNLLPSSFTSAAVVDCGPLSEAVKRAALVAERNTAVRLGFADGVVTVRAGTGDEAQACEVLTAEWAHDLFEVAYNPQYLLDGLTAAGEGPVRFGFNGEGKAAVITAGDGNPRFRYVLMPIRLGS